MDRIAVLIPCYNEAKTIEKVVNDFKRVSAPNKEKIAYQLNLYKLAYEQTYNKKIEGLYFTHLREEVRKFVPLPINEKAALELVDQYYKGE